MFMVFLKNLFKSKSSSLVLLGGNTGTGDHADAIYRKITELAGGKKGKIGVITSANEPYDWDRKKRGDLADEPSAKNSKMAANRYIKRFKEQGIKAEWIPIDLANKALADDKNLAKRITSGEYTGFFFGGGKQDYFTEAFFRKNAKEDSVDTIVLQAIKNSFKSGKLTIAGTSAGAVIQTANVMIVRGKGNQVIVEGAHEGKDFDRSTLQYLRGGGFGFFDHGIIDSHFSQRGREGRSIRLASDTDTRKVFGIDEATALVVTKANQKNPVMEIVGQNGVHIFDLKEAKSKINKESLWSINNVKSTYLIHGDQYIPKKDRVIFSADKKNIENQEMYRGRLRPTRDIFSSRKDAKNKFINTARNLVNTLDLKRAHGYMRTKGVDYRVTFNRSKQTEAYYIDRDAERQISYRDLIIAIAPKDNN